MLIQVKEVEERDLDQIMLLLEELYLELGENIERIKHLSTKFLKQLLYSKASTFLVVKNFVTNEIVTLATLTESKAIYANGKYGVLDEIITMNKYRSNHYEVNLKTEVMKIAAQKGWKRIDIATPTDAWHRTVRFYRNQEFRLTTPKFKYIVHLAGAA